MAEREPTAIERMAAAAHCCCDDMLAAVRELRNLLMLAAVRNLLDLEGGNPSLLPGTDANQAYDASNVIERIILEHDLRAGGKGE